MEQVEKVWILWEWGVSIYFIVKFAGFIGTADYQGSDLRMLARENISVPVFLGWVKETTAWQTTWERGELTDKTGLQREP